MESDTETGQEEPRVGLKEHTVHGWLSQKGDSLPLMSVTALHTGHLEPHNKMFSYVAQTGLDLEFPCLCLPSQ